MIKEFLKAIRAYFNTVYWFEIKKKVKFPKNIPEKLRIIRSYREVKKKELKNYFAYFPFKINRLKKNLQQLSTAYPYVIVPDFFAFFHSLNIFK